MNRTHQESVGGDGRMNEEQHDNDRGHEICRRFRGPATSQEVENAIEQVLIRNRIRALSNESAAAAEASSNGNLRTSCGGRDGCAGGIARE